MQQKDSLLATFSTQRWTIGQKIVKEGDAGDLLYIIKEGTVSCTQNDVEIRQMSKGEFFGEQSLLYNTPRTATITALSDVKVLSIGSEALIEVLGDSIQKIIYKNTQRIGIEKNDKLRSLSMNQRERVLDRMNIIKYTNNEVIIPRGSTKGDKL